MDEIPKRSVRQVFQSNFPQSFWFDIVACHTFFLIWFLFYAGSETAMTKQTVAGAIHSFLFGTDACLKFTNAEGKKVTLIYPQAKGHSTYVN
jgi:hypothetical protein